MLNCVAPESLVPAPPTDSVDVPAPPKGMLVTPPPVDDECSANPNGRTSVDAFDPNTLLAGLCLNVDPPPGEPKSPANTEKEAPPNTPVPVAAAVDSFAPTSFSASYSTLSSS